MASINTILLLGKPAAGKNIQRKLLTRALHCESVSSGDHFRSLAEHDETIQLMIESGELGSSDYMTRLLTGITEGLGQDDGFVFDGFARTFTQAEEFQKVLADAGRPYLAIHLDIPDAVVYERAHERLQVEGRSDDATRERIERRLLRYYENTPDVLQYFKLLDKLRRVDGTLSPEEVHKKILSHL